MSTNLLEGMSFEITAKDAARLADAAERFPQGSHVAVTALPGEAAEARVAAAATAARLGFRPSPHISARRLASEAELDRLLKALRQEAGIDRAFVVAGDPPVPAGPYEDALAVIQAGLLKSHGIIKVGISGYPEGHPTISDDRLWDALDRKAAALERQGHDVEIVTQFAFDADAVVAWIEQVRGRGIDCPIKIGLPGPASVKTLLVFAARCGVQASASVMKKYGVSITRLFDSAGPDRLLQDYRQALSGAHGPVSFHLYPFGGLKRAAEWSASYSEASLTDR